VKFQLKTGILSKERGGRMPKVITKITRQKRNEERYNIYVNEEYAFSVDENILVQYGLTKGKMLDEWTIGDIGFDDEVSRAFNRALGYLTYQMRSEDEVRKKLLDAEFGEAVINEAIHKLVRLGFLNDAAFSRAFVDTKKNTMKKGPRAIQQELKRKGIDDDTREQALAHFDEAEQLRLATELAEKKLRQETKKTPMQQKQKIQEFLLRKGYSFGIIEQVISQIDFSKAEDDWSLLIEAQGEKAWRKYAAKFTGYDLHMKVKQALYQKGFPGEVIDAFIEQKEQQNEEV
jgi:regulatory protein